MNTGKVKYVFRNFPLTSIHPQAQKAAEAAECAGEQGAYWEMHEALFFQQEQWSGQATAVQIFKSMAGELGLDQASFDACLDGGTYVQRVRQDQLEGTAAGVSGTPGFLVNGTLLSGAQPFSAFQQQIEYYLAGGVEPVLEVAADSYRSMGDADAPVIVTEFSDFQ